MYGTIVGAQRLLGNLEEMYRTFVHFDRGRLVGVVKYV